MNTEQRRAEIASNMKRDEEQGFDAFMENQTTKFLVSLIPTCNSPKTLETLLKTAFHAGFGVGGATILGGVLGAIASKDKGLH